jgi:hypothetical protein
MRKSKATEALRVATDIAALKAALNQHGYTIRKRPKQAAWIITPPLPKKTEKGKEKTAGTPTRQCYLLTYQPDPISSWVLHPQSDNPQRQTLLSILQNALAKQSTDITRKIS